jgi:hypothetical protein
MAFISPLRNSQVALNHRLDAWLGQAGGSGFGKPRPQLVLERAMLGQRRAC